MKTFVAIGDSIVAGEGDDANRGGWVGRVRERLPYDRGVDGWQVYNLGIGGNTIRDVEARLGEILVREPDVVLLGCLTNDVFMFPEEGPDGGHHVPKLPRHVREASWKRVLRKLTENCPKVMVTPGVVIEKDFLHTEQGPALGRGVRKVDIAAHMAFVEALCAEMNVVFVPVPPEMAEDGLRDHDVHWNGKGYDKVAALLLQNLTELQWI